MNVPVRRCAVALVLLLVSPGAPARAQSADSLAVRTAMSAFLDALNAFDVPRMSADFAADITAFVPSARVDRVVGKAAVTAIFQAFAERGRKLPRTTSVPEDMRIEVSGSLAVVSFIVDDPPPKPTRRRTFVWRKVGTRWLISHFHASDIQLPAR